MARPVRNYCEYFPHDRDMRNHKKIKSIRQKFGIKGYGIWCMLLEVLTGSDGNVFEDNDFELELLSGDFDVSVTEIRDVLNYCYRMELLFNIDGFVNSNSLDERLKTVYEKRKRAKNLSEKQKRKNGKFYSNDDCIGVSVTETTDETDISVEIMPQSKVNKSKVNKTKAKVINFPFEAFWDLYDKKVGERNKLEKKWESLTDDERQKAMQHIPSYKLAQPDKKFRKDPSTYLNNKSFNDEIIFNSNMIDAPPQPPKIEEPKNQPPREYWQIHYGHLAKTKEEFMQLVADGLIEE